MMEMSKKCPISAHNSYCNEECAFYTNLCIADTIPNIQIVGDDSEIHKKLPYCNALKCYIIP